MKITLIELDLQYSTATYQSALTSILDFFLSSEIATIQQIDGAAYKLKPRLFHKSILWTSTLVWTIPNSIIRLPNLLLLLSSLSAKSSVTFPSAIQLCISHFKVQMASFCYNSSTLVPPLGIPFNTILHFSDQKVYPPNTLWHSRRIYQRG